MWTDPNIPEFEMEWLQEDLVQNTLPVVVFAHQRLDRKTNYSVKNSEQIRAVLEKSNRVVAVFQGHSHQNDYQLINKIHYCTLVAMVEGPQQTNNAFSSSQKLQQDFNVAMARHDQGDMLSAMELFSSILKECPDDGPCQFYLNRCQDIQSKPTESIDPKNIVIEEK